MPLTPGTLSLVILLLLSASGVYAQTASIDSLKHLLVDQSTTYSGKKRVLILNEIAFEYVFFSYDTAMQYAQKGELLAREILFAEGEAQSYNVMGIVYRLEGNYARALESHLHSLKICERTHYPQGIANNYSNIGLLYYEKASYSLALLYYQKALKIKEKIGDTRGIAYSLNDMGNVYGHTKQWDKALETYQKTIEIREKLKDRHGIASSYNSIGKVWLAKGDTSKAVSFYRQALSNGQRYHDQIVIAETQNNLGNLYLFQKNYTQALTQFEKALAVALQVNAKIEVKNAYEGLSSSYKGIGNFAAAHRHLAQYTALKDSLFNLENTRRIAGLQFSYELEKKDQEIERQTLIKNALIIGIAVFLVLLIFLWRENRHKRKANTVLKSQKDEIIHQNLKLRQQTEEIMSQRDQLITQNVQITETDRLLHEANENLKEVNQKLEEIVRERTQDLQISNQELKLTNEELDLLLYRTSHDFRGPIATLTGLANLGNLESTDQPAVHELFERIGITADKMDKMIQKLYAVSYLNAKILDLQAVDFSLLVRKAQQNLEPIWSELHATCDVRVQGTLEAVSDSEVVEIIMENILENSLHFRVEARSPVINVEIESRYNFIEIRIQDNGTGILPKHIDKAFEMFFRGSEQSNGNGLGLYLVKKAVSRLHGQVRITSEVGAYTCLTLTLPKDYRAKAPFRESLSEAIPVSYPTEKTSLRLFR
jgi:signal transduction histidine kinase